MNAEDFMQGNSFNRLLVSGAARLALRAALLMLVCLSPAVASHAFDLASLFGSGGDSGSGKVARLEFRLRDGFAPTSIDWSPDGRYIATSGIHTRLIHIWDVEQRKLVKELELPNRPAAQFRSMAWSPDGQYLVTCNSRSSSLRIYSTGDWSVFRDFGPDQAVSCQKPVFSSDGTELTIWAADLVTFATGDWREIRRVPSQIFDDQLPTRPSFPLSWPFLIRDIGYVPNSHTLVLAGGQYERRVIEEACGPTPPVYTSRIWILEPDDKALTRSFLIHCSSIGGSDVTRLQVDLLGRRITIAAVEGSHRNTVRVVERSNGKLVGMPLEGVSDGIPRALAYTPDGRFLLIGENSGDGPSPLYILDAKTLQVLDVVHAVARIRDVAVHPGSTMFVAAAFDGFTVWRFVGDKH
jgi:WD40 repeat protein